MWCERAARHTPRAQRENAALWWVNALRLGGGVEVLPAV